MYDIDITLVKMLYNYRLDYRPVTYELIIFYILPLPPPPPKKKEKQNICGIWKLSF